MMKLPGLSKLKSFLFVCRREDSGLLGYKEHLPVSQVAVGDTNRPGSEAKMTVGPLRCQGDSKSPILSYSQSAISKHFQINEVVCDI